MKPIRVYRRVCVCCTCTCKRAAGDPCILHVVTVVLLPVAVGTLLQKELVPRALHGIQEDRARTLTEVSPRPGLRHTPTNTHMHGFIFVSKWDLMTA